MIWHPASEWLANLASSQKIHHSTMLRLEKQMSDAGLISQDLPGRWDQAP